MKLPTGNLTFLFTDIEGSSRLWESNLAAMGTSLALHDRIIRESVVTHRGVVFKTVGDAFCVVFNEAPDAVAAANASQRRLAEADWENNEPLKVRMAIHTGVAELRESDYFGPTLNRVARLLATGHGGQTLLSLATEDLVHDRLPANVSLRDLGENRLRDLARPERIFELVIDGLNTEFPPLRSLEQFPNNLPVQLTSFIGREKELAEVRTRLETTHLLTLTGPGGTGKTRLSLQVAADLVDQFPDGIWLVELATESEADNVAANIASVLDLRSEGEQSIELVLSHFLSRKNLLLILDNCEHLILPIARLAETLLRNSAKLRILASSRIPLGIAGELTWPVPPLSTPQLSRWGDLIRYTIEELGSFESIRLFMDRAKAAVPAFQLTTENAPAISRICYRLDGVALALELAAARVKVLTPEQIADRLQNRFSLLTGGSRTALPRQQTLRALIDWSYDLLTDQEQLLFRRLAVFGGGRTLSAIEAVCTGDGIEEGEVLDLLTQLLDKSLVSIETGPAEEPRYVLTESIWQYAQSKLDESPESDTINTRHLGYFRAQAELAEPELKGPDQARWLEQHSADRINFRFALEWAVKDSSRVEEGLKLAVALTRYWEIHGILKEGRAHLSNLLAKADSTPRLLLARAYGCAGRLAWCQDANVAARELIHKCIQMTEEIDAWKENGENLAVLGFIERLDNDIDLAETHFHKCVVLAKVYNNPRLQAMGNAGLGSVAGDRGDFDTAVRLKLQTLEIFRRLGDKYLVGLNSWSLGTSSFRAGNLDVAESYFRECLAIARELANRWVMPHLIEGAGDLALARGEHKTGLTLFGSASVMRERLGLDFAPSDAQIYQETLAKFRALFNEVEYDRLWQEGRKLTPPAAIALAFPT